MNLKTNLTKYNFKAGGNAIKYLVIHDTGNKNDSDEGNAKYFSVDGRKASAHYFVDDDSCTQLVKDVDIAWHVGDGKGLYGIKNNNSIGIEMCRVNDTVTSQTEANAIELAVSIMKKYHIHPDFLVRHYDASRKNCPSSFSANDWARWKAFKAKVVALVGDKRVPVKMPVLKLNVDCPEVKILQEKLIAKGFLKIPNPTGLFRDKTNEAVKAFQVSCGFSGEDVDGIVGPETWDYILK